MVGLAVLGWWWYQSMQLLEGPLERYEVTAEDVPEAYRAKFILDQNLPEDVADTPEERQAERDILEALAPDGSGITAVPPGLSNDSQDQAQLDLLDALSN